jgi:hypothetical protein
MVMMQKMMIGVTTSGVMLLNKIIYMFYVKQNPKMKYVKKKIKNG